MAGVEYVPRTLRCLLGAGVLAVLCLIVPGAPAAYAAPGLRADPTAPEAPANPQVVSVGAQEVGVGSSQTIAVTGFAPGELVLVRLSPTGQQFGPIETNSDGAARVVFDIAADAPGGGYRASFLGLGSRARLVVTFVVTAPPAPVPPVPVSPVPAPAPVPVPAPVPPPAPPTSAPSTGQMPGTPGSSQGVPVSPGVSMAPGGPGTSDTAGLSGSAGMSSGAGSSAGPVTVTSSGPVRTATTAPHSSAAKSLAPRSAPHSSAAHSYVPAGTAPGARPGDSTAGRWPPGWMWAGGGIALACLVGVALVLVRRRRAADAAEQVPEPVRRGRHAAD